MKQFKLLMCVVVVVLFAMGLNISFSLNKAYGAVQYSCSIVISATFNNANPDGVAFTDGRFEDYLDRAYQVENVGTPNSLSNLTAYFVNYNILATKSGDNVSFKINIPTPFNQPCSSADSLNSAIDFYDNNLVTIANDLDQFHFDVVDANNDGVLDRSVIETNANNNNNGNNGNANGNNNGNANGGNTGTTSSGTTITGFGGSCVNNYSTCPTGSKNFLQSLGDGSISAYSTLLSDQQLTNGVTNAFEANLITRLCVDNSITDLIPVFGNPTGPDGVELLVPDGDAAKDIYVRACAAGFEPQQTVSDGIRAKVWGCCPSGHVYVVPKSASSDTQLANASYCCPTNNWSTSDPRYPRYGDFNTRDCYSDASGTTNGTTGIGPDRANWPNDNINVLGVAIGKTSSRLTPNISFPGSSKKCARDNMCATVEINAGGATTVEVLNGGSIFVLDGDLFNQQGDLACKTCFDEDEPIALTKVGEVTQLVTCDPNNIADGTPDLLRFSDLINNNIADTLAVLEAQKNNDPTNAAFIANCRAQGGLPTALGCIDTTPVGIITGLIRIALGTMGGVSLIQLIIVGLRYMQGDEGEIKKAREQLVATLTGLATLVFSVLILRILGVNILDIIPAGTI